MIVINGHLEAFHMRDINKLNLRLLIFFKRVARMYDMAVASQLGLWRILAGDWRPAAGVALTCGMAFPLPQSCSSGIVDLPSPASISV